ncbi:MAG: hypothetical protein ABI068_15930 [Ktedonobacterales bacterium]
MNERKAAGYYGRMVGLVAGLFAVVQVLIAHAAVQGEQGAYDSYQLAIARFSHSQPTDFTLFIPNMLNILIVTYAAMLFCGFITVVLSWYAGRLAAQAIGRHARGASAGTAVWWVSSLIWLVASIAGVFITHTDGTIASMLAPLISWLANNASADTYFLPWTLALLVVQIILASLFCWWVCAVAGYMGASSAPLVAPAYTYMPPPFPGMAPGMYPGMVFRAGAPPAYPGGYLAPGAWPSPPPTGAYPFLPPQAPGSGNTSSARAPGNTANTGTTANTGSSGAVSYPPPPTHYMPPQSEPPTTQS